MAKGRGRFPSQISITPAQAAIAKTFALSPEGYFEDVTLNEKTES
jgi:hypothetical protein